MKAKVGPRRMGQSAVVSHERKLGTEEAPGPGAGAQGPSSLPGHVAPVAQSRASDKDTG